MRTRGDGSGLEAQDALLVDDEDIFVASAISSGYATRRHEQRRRYPGFCQKGPCLHGKAVVPVEREDLDAGFVAVALMNIGFKGGTRRYASPSVPSDEKEDGDRVARMTDAVRSAIGGSKLKLGHFVAHILGKGGRTQRQKQGEKEETGFHGVPPLDKGGEDGRRKTEDGRRKTKVVRTGN